MFKKYRTKKLLNRAAQLFKDVADWNSYNHQQRLNMYEEIEKIFAKVDFPIPEEHITEMKISKSDTLKRCGLISEAEELLISVLNQHPTNIRALNDYGCLAIDAGEYLEGIERFNISIEIESNNPNALYYRGVCHSYLGANKLAIDDFKQSLNQDSNTPETYHDLALILLDTKQFKKSLEICNQGLNCFPENGDIYLIAGKCHLGLNEMELACNKLSKAEEFKNEKANELLKVHCNSNLL